MPVTNQAPGRNALLIPVPGSSEKNLHLLPHQWLELTQLRPKLAQLSQAQFLNRMVRIWKAYANSHVRISRRCPQREAVPRYAAEVAATKKQALTGPKPTGASLSHLLVRNHSHVLLDEFLDLATGDFVFWILDRALLKLVGQAWRTE